MYIVTPITPKTRQWIDDNVGIEDWQWTGGGFAIDHHFVDDLIEGMTEAELLPKTDFNVVHCGG